MEWGDWTVPATDEEFRRLRDERRARHIWVMISLNLITGLLGLTTGIVALVKMGVL